MVDLHDLAVHPVGVPSAVIGEGTISPGATDWEIMEQTSDSGFGPGAEQGRESKRWVICAPGPRRE